MKQCTSSGSPALHSPECFPSLSPNIAPRPSMPERSTRVSLPCVPRPRPRARLPPVNWFAGRGHRVRRPGCHVEEGILFFLVTANILTCGRRTKFCWCLCGEISLCSRYLPARFCVARERALGVGLQFFGSTCTLSDAHDVGVSLLASRLRLLEKILLVSSSAGWHRPESISQGLGFEFHI